MKLKGGKILFDLRRRAAPKTNSSVKHDVSKTQIHPHKYPSYMIPIVTFICCVALKYAIAFL